MADMADFVCDITHTNNKKSEEPIPMPPKADVPICPMKAVSIKAMMGSAIRANMAGSARGFTSFMEIYSGVAVMDHKESNVNQSLRKDLVKYAQ